MTPRLLAVFLLGLAGWALVVQLKVTRSAAPGSPGPLAPLLYGVTAAALAPRRRWAVPPLVGFAILAGGLWGYHTFLALHAAAPPWDNLLLNYLRYHLPHAPTWDKLNPAAGIIGALAGLSLFPPRPHRP